MNENHDADSHRIVAGIGGPEDFFNFATRYLDDEFVVFCAAECNLTIEETRAELKTNINEALVGLDVLIRHFPAQDPGRVLEVGSGLRLLSLYLADRGYDTTALEPVGPGFSFYDKAGDAIWKWTQTRKPGRIDLTAKELEPNIHGSFDFIFSIHVLEHIDDLDASVGAMANVLSPTGKMVHLCPNYAFPYEPHFKIPLIPLNEQLSGKLFLPDGVTASPLWSSLNFVSAGKVRKMMKSRGLSISFRKGVMTSFIERMRNDEIFAARHSSGAMGVLMRLVLGLRLEKILFHMPPSFATPMEFIAKQADTLK